MAIKKILVVGAPVLSQQSIEVEKIDSETLELIKDMADTMYNAPGVGLAAPQIGSSKKIIVFDVSVDDKDSKVKGLQVIINPCITKKTGKVVFRESCLSVPEFEQEVERGEIVEVQGLDCEGKEIKLTLDGLASIVVQHEIDHLEGVLICDRASRLKKKMYLEKLKKIREL